MGEVGGRCEMEGEVEHTSYRGGIYAEECG